jgi:glyoxylase-like metal-dependent hydrolase (beta-lactamase superfamily II)
LPPAPARFSLSPMRRIPGLVLVMLPLLALSPSAAPDYTIQAVRYASVPQFPLNGLIPGAPADQKIDIAMVVWVISGNGRTILFDSGFHRARWITQFKVADFIRPDSALARAGIPPESVTDIIVSHAHWDHMGGIDLFPNVTVWIQKQEYQYYLGDAWQEGGRKGGIDPEDLRALLDKNTNGKLKLIDGDDVEIMPGIRVFTGARHTYASQYLRVDGATPYVLASDNAYLFRNIEGRQASATFSPADREGNLAAIDRMIRLAGSATRVIPGHDPEQFQRFPTQGRVARIR